MEPIGTITMYFPFIAEEDRKIIESVMEKAGNYRDFTNKLCETVCSTEESESLVYFTSMHALYCDDLECISRLESIYRSNILIKPRVLFSRLVQGEQGLVDSILQAADKAIETNPAKWIIMDLKILKIPVVVIPNPSDSRFIKMQEDAEMFLQEHDDLDCFVPFVSNWRGFYHEYVENDFETARKYYEKGIGYARKFGNLLSLATLLSVLARVLGASNATKSLALLAEAANLYQILDNQDGLASVYNTSGHISNTLGLPDQALESYLESARIYDSIGAPQSRVYSNIARTYCDLNQGEKAVIFARKAVEISEYENPLTYLRLARALILTGQIEEAVEYLDKTTELAPKDEYVLAVYFLTRGQLEMEKQDIRAASQTLKRALRISDSLPHLNLKGRSLLALVEAEVAHFTQNNAKKHLGTAELYLARLNQIASELEIPGLQAQTSLLDAELRALEGKWEDARDTLEKALAISKTAGMESIHRTIKDRLAKLDEKEPQPSLLNRFKDLVKRVIVPSVQVKDIPLNILGCIVMAQESGIEIYSKYTDNRLVSDPSLVAGLISAVSAFAHELKADARGQLQSIVHEDIAVLLEHGDYITGALLADKDTYDARALLRRFLEKFEEKFYDDLKSFDGRTKKFRAADELFIIILEKRKMPD